MQLLIALVPARADTAADGDGVLNEDEVQTFVDRLMQRRGAGGGRRGGGGGARGGGAAAAEASASGPAPEQPPYTETKSKGGAVCKLASS